MTAPTDSTRPAGRREAPVPPRRDRQRAVEPSGRASPGVEIERKFIVRELPPELDRAAAERVCQGYLAAGRRPPLGARLFARDPRQLARRIERAEPITV
jgi:hypothetical protein